jgi:hypothetical protein
MLLARGCKSVTLTSDGRSAFVEVIVETIEADTNTVFAIDLATGAARSIADDVEEFAVTLDGRIAAMRCGTSKSYCGNKGTIVDLKSGQVIQKFTFDKFRFRPDGRGFAYTLDEKRVEIWQLYT